MKFIKKHKNILLGLLILGTLTSGVVLAQIFGYFPRYPTRINAIVKELNVAGADLAYLNKHLKNLADECSCSNAQSMCGQIKFGAFSNINNSCQVESFRVFGEPCQKRNIIEGTEDKIYNKLDQITYLRELLEKEMASGLEAELKTLREDEANQLRSSLNDLLSSSKEMSESSEKNLGILRSDEYAVSKKCSANCQQDPVLGIKACLLDNGGEQGNIKLKFEAGVRLQDLELGEIKIERIRLNLPDKLSLGEIAKFGDFNIPLPDATIDYPDVNVGKKSFGVNPVVIHPPMPQFSGFSLGDYSCFKTTAKNYNCQIQGGEKIDNTHNSLEWYLGTFSWLSEKCQELPAATENNLPSQKNFTKCMDKGNVHTYIIAQCNALWEDYLACLITKPLGSYCNLPTGICISLDRPKDRAKTIARECRSLFNETGETVPVACGSKELEDKCNAIKEEGSMGIPEQCMYLPLFTGKFEDPTGQKYQGLPTSCPSQTISDIPSTNISLNCPVSYTSSSKPKLDLPNIIIPDVKLPTFSFMPFFKVKLPSFIFEDLNFSSYNLCDFDDCLDILPPLNLDIPYPALRINPIEIPHVGTYLPMGGDIGDLAIDIDVDKVEMPPVPAIFPNIDAAKLISLDLEMPNISLPQPEIILKFAGIEMDAFNILLGLVSSIISIPTGCVGGGISGLPIVISYPDYYFYWPKYLKNIDLCNNEYTNVSSFCKKAKDSIYNELTPKITEIQSTINKAMQDNVQKYMDQASELFNKTVKREITQGIKEAEETIKQAAKREIEKYLSSSGKDLPDSIPLKDINIPAEKFEGVNQLLSKIPKEIPINWPAGLKEMKLSRPIVQKLPDISLGDLSYIRKKEIPLPGLQLKSFSFSISGLGQNAACQSKDPTGGNPYPMDRINVNLGEVVDFSTAIDKSAREINDILN